MVRSGNSFWREKSFIGRFFVFQSQIFKSVDPSSPGILWNVQWELGLLELRSKKNIGHAVSLRQGQEYFVFVDANLKRPCYHSIFSIRVNMRIELTQSRVCRSG
jgi:hypothetical protein